MHNSRPVKLIASAIKNAYRIPYKATTSMYWMADYICPEYESEEVNTVLKIIPTMSIIWACSSPLLPLMALGFNYQTSINNLEARSTYNDLQALANGNIPQPQSFKNYHHIANLFCALNIANLFCALSLGIPGIIVTSLLNQTIPN